MKRIAILTSGGDAPGMNAAIRAAARTIIGGGGEAYGVRNGYSGLLHGDIFPLSARDVGGIMELGGTMLGSARCPEFKSFEGLDRGATMLRRLCIDGLIVIGGNGSQTGANALAEIQVPVMGVALTIDNDLAGTDVTIGFDTALNITLEAIDRLRTTASSHHRVFVIETMGNRSGFLPLMAGLAGGAEAIVTPEMDLTPEQVLEKVYAARHRGKKHVMIVVSEWAPHHADAFHQHLCQDKELDYDPRLTVLGHVVRGGRPTAADRILATRLASGAASELMNGNKGCLAAMVNNQVKFVPLGDVAGKTKPAPEEMIRLAEQMSI